ncbi:RHS repeat-associated core domain-containing protein [Nitrospirillum sp. BR 11163]|uniref:RHS repeat domain-containing protein n=1 Tax=Nitrospirillum sp. BR 11163 TaxID=3104323 RepID=UPI002AFE0BD2|nr:RHS repeat-associated core domain-containing protein [Nitrospirillum sp. BR 11163]MEA1676222.1 RHS repeat-associated core domain-containing protein [Nitrospirillum sp. BR 11163]
MSYAQISINYNADNGTPLQGYIQHDYCQGQGEDCTDEFYVARIGNNMVTFPLSSGATTTAFTGETLVTNIANEYVIYDKNGTKWEFTRQDPVNGSGQMQVGMLSRITYRDDRTLTYYYSNNNLNTFIFSSDGYELVSCNSQAVVTLLNLAQDYRDPNGTCDVTSSWPTFRFSNGVHTDPLSRSTSISTNQVSSTQTDYTIGRPGGLQQKITKSIVTLYSYPTSGTYVQRNLVTHFDDGYFWTNYSYTGDGLAVVTHSSAGSSDGSTVQYDNTSGYTLIDQLNRRTTYTFASQYMTHWSSTLVDTFLTGKQLPEQLQQQWTPDPAGTGNILSASVVAKPSSGLPTLAVSANFPSCDASTDYRHCHLPSSTIDARKAQTDYTYHPVTGMISTKRLPPDANGVRAKIRYTYEQRSAIYKTSANGTPTTGPAIWKLVKISTCRTMADDDCLNPGNAGDELQTLIDYNDNLLPVSETVRSGDGALISTKTRAYDSVGNVTWEDGPVPGTADRVYYFWDADRELVGQIGPHPDAPNGPTGYAAVRTTYNADGLPTDVERGSASSQTKDALASMSVVDHQNVKYDTLGRKTSETWSAGNTPYRHLQYSYDSSKRLHCMAERMDPSSSALNDNSTDACTQRSGNAASGAPPDRITSYTYDAAGQVTQIRKGVGSAQEQVSANYKYSADGKQTDILDANGNHTQLTYDGYDREIKWAFPSPARPANYNASTVDSAFQTAGQVSSTDVEQYQYDENGNRTKLTKRSGTSFTYAYDQLNRVTQALYPSGTPSVYTTYDNQGRVTRVTDGQRPNDPNGNKIIIDYDGLGRKTAETQNDRKLSFAYDIDGNHQTANRRTSLTWPDGVSVSYTYQVTGEVWKIQDNAGATLATYTYDILGRRLSLSPGNGTKTSYSYNSDGSLATLEHDVANAEANVKWAFTYSPARQITGTTLSNTAYSMIPVSGATNYDVNGLNQATSAGGGAIGYDTNGNLVSGGGWTYGYDALNRLTSASGLGTSSGYIYDPQGRRIAKTANGSKTLYLYDGGNLVAEYSGSSGSLVRRYVFGPGVDEPLVEYTDTGAKKWFYRDWQGSVIALADGGGTVNGGDVYNYGPYGEIGLTSTTSLFRYTGQVYDPETGLYHYKARAYSPTLGRFLQTDPIGYKDDLNLYAYVGGIRSTGRIRRERRPCITCPTVIYTSSKPLTIEPPNLESLGPSSLQMIRSLL